MCNVSTGHAQGPSQWAPVFSQAIPFPQILSPCQYKAVHMQHLVSNHSVIIQLLNHQDSSCIPTWISHSKELMNSEPL